MSGFFAPDSRRQSGSCCPGVAGTDLCLAGEHKLLTEHLDDAALAAGRLRLGWLVVVVPAWPVPRL